MQNTARPSVAIISVAALTLLFVSCAAGPGDITQRAGGHVLWTPAQEPGMHMLMGIEGRLEVMDTGCFTLGHPFSPEQIEAMPAELREEVTRDTEPTPVKFPYGTTLSDDGQSINVPGLGEVSIGETLTGGGGHISLDPEDAEDVPPECVADGVLIFSSAP
ncbi:hypothetical protein [Pseudoclavibacter helvolus]|uniref:hypothetical protein n=1 Tax=Pseudoclavibacter helvolus TaxID=255205 RepID=UPI003C78D9E2